MEAFRHSDLVEIRRDPTKGSGGRGVFARRPIAAGTIFERVPVVIFPRAQVFDKTDVPRPECLLTWYVYEWSLEQGEPLVAVAFGYGSLYNHSYQPNAIYRLEAPDAIAYVAIRHIEANEEIMLNYNGEPDDNTPVEFDAVD